MGKRQQEEEQGHSLTVEIAVVDGLVAVHKQPQRIAHHEKQQNARQLRQGHARENAGGGPLLHPVVLLRAQVLAHEGGKSQGNAHDREEHQPLDLGVGPVAGDGVSSKGVDVGLHDQVADAYDGALDARRQALGQNLAQDVGVKMEAPELQPHLALRPAHADDAEHGA